MEFGNDFSQFEKLNEIKVFNFTFENVNERYCVIFGAAD